MTRVTLSGIGLVTAYGLGTTVFRDGLLANRPAFAESLHGPAFACVPKGVISAPVGSRKDALTALVVGEALADAGMPRLPPGGIVVVAAQVPWTGASDAWMREFEGPSLKPLGRFGINDAIHLSHACASAAFAVTWACELLLAGNAETALIIGVNTANPYEAASMDVIKALSRGVARPFDIRRDGITLGEGGGAIVLETERHARTRGARRDIVVSGTSGSISGSGTATSDSGAIRTCITRTLADSGIAEIEYIHAHATGTPQGDQAEADGLAEIAVNAGWTRPVLTSSHKGAIGHLLHASAIPGIAAAADALRTATAPPTPGLREPLPSVTLHLNRQPEHIPSAKHALVNSFGFNGSNATVLLSRVSGWDREF